MVNRCILVLALTLLMNLKSGDGYPINPFVRFHLCMMNELPHDNLNLICYQTQRTEGSKKVDSKSDLNWDEPQQLVIPPMGSYNWTFHRYLVGFVSYYCNADYSNGHFLRTMFEAFIDTKQFLDNGCGGRHCVWKFADNGILLYNVHQKADRYMYRWYTQN